MVTQAAGGIELFIPKTYDIVWSLVILLVVAVFFYKFFMPKFQAIFDERANKIQGNIDKAKKEREDAAAAKKSYEKQLSLAKVEGSKIRDDARAEASHIIADARLRAESEAAQITTNAQRSIDTQQKQAMVTLRGQIGTLATALAGKILGSQLQNESEQTAMIDDMISKLDDKPRH